MSADIMDRDFALRVTAPQAVRSCAVCGADGDGVAAVASFQPRLPAAQRQRPLNLVVVIDCSGSMEGDSVEQARQAVASICDALQPADHVGLIAFGKTTRVLSDKLLQCSKANLAEARRFASELRADMGGTEVGKALRDAYAVAGHSESVDVLLVTDGEVSSWPSVIEEAKQSGRRIFTVGVGSAVSEAFVRGLADSTGGACELVSPREGMADRVMRHVERMRAPRAKQATIEWPEGAHDLAPAKVGGVFAGDTVVSYAKFDRASCVGQVVLTIETEDGEVIRQELPVTAATSTDSAERLSTVARLAAAARLKELEHRTGLETALRYRLVSPWTNWLVIAVRPDDEKAQGLPQICKVRQTLAAGWSGTGAVMMLGLPSMDAPACRAAAWVQEPRLERSEWLPALLASVEREPATLQPSRALELLADAGLTSELDALFCLAADLGIGPSVVAALVLAAILSRPSVAPLSPSARAAVADLAVYGHGELQRRSHEVEAVARELLRVVGGMHAAAARRVIEPDLARRVELGASETLERLDMFRSLLDRAQQRAAIDSLTTARTLGTVESGL